MEANTVIDRFMKRDRATRLEYLSWFYGGVTLTLLVIGLVSQRTGEDPSLNMIYWSTSMKIMWTAGTLVAMTATGICKFMKREELNPKLGVRPWHWYELAFAAIALTLALILSIVKSVTIAQ